MRNYRTNEPIDVDLDKCLPKFFYFDTLKTLEDCISKEQYKLKKMQIGDLLFLRKEKEIYYFCFTRL